MEGIWVAVMTLHLQVSPAVNCKLERRKGEIERFESRGKEGLYMNIVQG